MQSMHDRRSRCSAKYLYLAHNNKLNMKTTLGL
jgi:hypothetical protein